MDNHTQIFSIEDALDEEIRSTISLVNTALEEKGYRPINQLVGYILSGDPTYFTTHKNARNLICKIDRDELLRAVMKSYLKAC